MATCVTACASSQSRSTSNSAAVVPNVRTSCLRSPGLPGPRRHAATVFLWTSNPATRSSTRSLAVPPREVTRPRAGAFAARLCSTGSEAPMRGSGRSLVSFFPDSRYQSYATYPRGSAVRMIAPFHPAGWAAVAHDRFFRMSRSMRSVRFSRRGRPSSSRSSLVSAPGAPRPASISACRTQLRRAVSVRSSSRATVPTVFPLSRTIRTACALNSFVNARRLRLVMTHSYRTFVRSGVSTKPGQVHDDKRPPEPQNRPAGQQQHLTRTVDAWLCDKGGLRHVPGPVASSDARVRSEAGYHQHFRHRRTGLAVHEARSLYAHWIVARNQWDAAAQRSVEHNRATQGSRKPVSAGATLEKLH